jgi:hypothetical protein
MSKSKPNFGKTIAIDFDGVLHKYNGWQDGKIDGPIHGSLDAIKALCKKRHVIIFTTRPEAIVKEWLKKYGFPSLAVTNKKEKFYVMVDDRGIRFDGEWTDEIIHSIFKFEPYWIKNRNGHGSSS